jgi:hypothetical protein
MTVRDALNEGKADFNRYAESGQVMINRAQHLGEWQNVHLFRTEQALAAFLQATVGIAVQRHEC